ncbi:MAG: hypothetical protein KBC22_02715 [Candidatus Pacebacteria bacterium]|nr:hypothetical protein [Candidatus Paceibacterota bacterium]
MKKFIFTFLSVVIASVQISAQVKLMFPTHAESAVVSWDMCDFATSPCTYLGKVYTVEAGAQISFLHNNPTSQGYKATMALTGAYTSDMQTMTIAGSAYDANCNEIGNPHDRLFKPNSYLAFGHGTVTFTDQPQCNAFQVYKLVDKNNILWDVVNARTKNATLWRFLVKKEWQRIHADGKVERGNDVMIVDFDKSLTLSQACSYIQELSRNTMYGTSKYTSTVTACLLDTGTFRPFLLQGKEVGGQFPQRQSNLIVIN